MPGLGEVTRLGVRVHEVADRCHAVVRRDAGRDQVAGLDGHAERGAVAAGVVVHHRLDLELVEPGGEDGRADQAARVAGHERDLLGRDQLGSDAEVALVLAVLVVDDDDEPAVLEVRQGLGYGCESHQCPPSLTRNPMRRATYQRAMVRSSVCGIRATPKVPSSSFTSVTVRLVPSRVIEPFSATYGASSSGSAKWTSRPSSGSATRTTRATPST